MTQVMDLVPRVRRLLQDTGTLQRVSDADLLDWYNEAIKVICKNNPFALTATVNHLCVAKPVQTLAGAQRVLDVIRNVGGRTITRAREGDIAREIPGWHNDLPASEAFHWMVHQEEGKFLLYPLPAANVIVEVVTQTEPTAVTRLTDELELDIRYEALLVDYLAYRCLAEDADNVANHELANDYLMKFEKAANELYEMEAQRYAVR